MRPTRILVLYGLTILAFFLVDLVWLVLVAPGFYGHHLGHLLADTVNWGAALGFYLLFVGGIVMLAVVPAVERRSPARAVLAGAFLGLVAYGTYDLTNLATLRDWPLIVTVVDLIWGTILAGTVSVLGYWIAMRVG